MYCKQDKQNKYTYMAQCCKLDRSCLYKGAIAAWFHPVVDRSVLVAQKRRNMETSIGERLRFQVLLVF